MTPPSRPGAPQGDLPLQIDLHRLRVFYEAALAGSFTRAAERLLVSQPAVSQQIRQLERELGLTLFQRLGRQVQLTEAGARLRDYTERIFGLVGEAERSLLELRDLGAGTLRVGAGTTPGIYVLPAYLGRFKAAHPGVEVRLEVAGSDSVLRRLLAHGVELAVLGRPADHPAVMEEPILEDELRLVVPADHQLAGRGAVAVEELRGMQLIAREPGSATRQLAERALAISGVEAEVVMELGSTDAIKQAVAHGLGVALISRFAVDPEARLGSLVPVEVRGIDLRRSFHLAWQRQVQLSPAARAFLALLRREVAASG